MIVDTVGLPPEASGLVMVCTSPPVERLTRGTLFWDFSFATTLEGEEVPYREAVPIWLVGPVFKALGFKEVTPGRFEIEPTEAVGRKFKCDLVHEKIKDKVYARMKNMTPIFEGGLKPEDIDAESGIPF